ncbi:hypothetical protein LEMLEM_LOCUS20316 [Lemmus lemmus]
MPVARPHTAGPGRIALFLVTLLLGSPVAAREEDGETLPIFTCDELSRVPSGSLLPMTDATHAATQGRLEEGCCPTLQNISSSICESQMRLSPDFSLATA